MRLWKSVFIALVTFVLFPTLLILPWYLRDCDVSTTGVAVPNWSFAAYSNVGIVLALIGWTSNLIVARSSSKAGWILLFVLEAFLVTSGALAAVAAPVWKAWNAAFRVPTHVSNRYGIYSSVVLNVQNMQNRLVIITLATSGSVASRSVTFSVDGNSDFRQIPRAGDVVTAKGWIISDKQNEIMQVRKFKDLEWSGKMTADQLAKIPPRFIADLPDATDTYQER